LEFRWLAASDLAHAAALLPATNAGLPTDELERDLRSAWTRWPSLQIGAFDGPMLVGLIAGRIDARDETLGWSDDTVLRPEYRRRGLGTSLLYRQLDAFRALGCTRVRGLSPDSHLSELQFFERHGFRVVGETLAHGVWGVRDGERLRITERRLDLPSPNA